MPRLEATGAQGIRLHKLVDLVAGSSTFQSRRQIFDPVELEEKHIHWPWLRKELNEKIHRPCTVIEQLPVTWTSPAKGTMMPDGALKLTITDNARQGSMEDSFTDFTNFADGLIKDIVEAVQVNDALDATMIEQIQTPLHSPDNEPVKYWSTIYRIDWGR